MKVKSGGQIYAARVMLRLINKWNERSCLTSSPLFRRLLGTTHGQCINTGQLCKQTTKVKTSSFIKFLDQ